MKITRIRVHHLEASLSRRFGWSLGWTDRRTATLVEVETSDGLKGWGDGRAGRDPSLALGRSPFEAASIWEAQRPPMVLQSRRGEAICGGLDTALWDLQAKVVGLPLHRLMGHTHRSRVQPYLTALYRQDWSDFASGLAEEALAWKAKGYRTLKMKIGYGPELDVRLVRAVRAAIGDDVALGVDANCAYDAGTAIALARRLEAFDLAWWEEPLLADDLDGYQRLRASTAIPLASGETMGADALVRDYIAPRAVAIVQPEIELIGITGAMKVSHAAWTQKLRVIPHNWGTAVRTAAILHWMAAQPPLTEALAAPAVLFEFDQTESPFRDAVIHERIEPGDDGLIAVPTAPGLGVTVDEDAVARFRVKLEEY